MLDRTLVVDSSALVAIFLGEPERPTLLKLLAQHRSAISAVTVLETKVVMLGRHGPSAIAEVDAFLHVIACAVIAFDEEQSAIAAQAAGQYGKGRHPAALNFGDCCSYALAKSLALPLLFKGNDFSKTDVLSA